MNRLIINSSITSVISKAIQGLSLVAPNYNPKHLYLKHGPIQKIPDQDSIILRVNSKMDISQIKKFPNLSIWSNAHLNSLLLDQSKIQMKNVCICNPFKPYNLVENGLKSGISEMVIQDLDELEKIQEMKYQIMKQNQKLIETKYVWNIVDFQEDLELLNNLAKYSFKISSITCSTQKGQQKQRVLKFVDKVKKLGHPIEKLTLRTNVSEYAQKMKRYSNSSLKIQYQICDIDHTRSFNVICQVFGFDKQRNPVVSQQCQTLIEKTNDNKFNIIQIDGKKWIAGKPAYLDLNCINMIDLTK